MPRGWRITGPFRWLEIHAIAIGSVVPGSRWTWSVRWTLAMSANDTVAGDAPLWNVRRTRCRYIGRWRARAGR